MNNLIAQRVKDARMERGYTQKDLAAHLGKTSAAVSDLERGKVQITASDLHSISQFLNQPIEYFFGEQIGDAEIQNMVSVLRRQSPEARNSSVQLTSMIVRMQELSDQLNAIPDDQEVPVEMITEFYNIFVPFSLGINDMAKQLKELKDVFDEELKKRGIDLSTK